MLSGPLLDRVPPAVGAVSVALSAIGLASPRALARAAGVRAAGETALPLLVRLIAARQGALGLALLTRVPVDVRRSAALFLPLTTADLTAVAAATAAGALHRRSLVMATAVLAVNAAVLVAASRGREPR